MEEKTISSQVFTKNNKFIIIDNFYIISDANRKIKKLKIKCVECGEEQIILNSHKERCVCKNCRINKNNDEYIGKIFGTYLVDSYSHTIKNSKYFNVICQKCKSESKKTLKTILAKVSTCSKCKGNSKIPTLDAPINCVKYGYITGAQDRNLEFDLNDLEFRNLISGNCHYCGSEPTEYSGDKQFNKTNQNFIRNGIDRIDSTKGYNVDNCVSCCKKCNQMKSNYDKNEFLNHINKIYNNVNKGSTTIPKGSTLQANGSGNGVFPN